MASPPVQDVSHAVSHAQVADETSHVTDSQEMLVHDASMPPKDKRPREGPEPAQGTGRPSSLRRTAPGGRAPLPATGARHKDDGRCYPLAGVMGE